MRTYRLLLVAMMLAFLATQTGCQTALAQDQATQAAVGESNAQFRERSDVRTWSYTVNPEMSHVDLKINVRLTGGAAAWVLIDPQGQVRWKGEAPDTCRLILSRRFEPIAGEWKFTLVLAQASGEYTTNWRAR